MLILTSVLGFLAVITDIISAAQKSRIKLLTIASVSNLFTSFQYILLGAISGAITTGIGLFRNIILSNKDKLSTNIIMYVLMLIYSVIGLLAYDGLVSLIPTVASIIYVYVLWQSDINSIKKGNIIVYSLWFVYDLLIGAYVACIANVVVIILAIKDLIKENKEEKIKNKKQNKLETKLA